MNESFLKTIDLLESCISRMAQNSFIVKGWTITLTGVILALVPETLDVRLICIICLMLIISFWIVDALYLKNERKFRNKYEKLIKNPDKEEYWFDLNIRDSTDDCKTKLICTMFSLSVWPIYIPLLLASAILFVNQYTHWFG